MINIYVIRSEHLQNRWKSIDKTINRIGNLMQSQNMKYTVINIISPTFEEIEKNIKDYNNKIDLHCSGSYSIGDALVFVVGGSYFLSGMLFTKAALLEDNRNAEIL